MVALVLVATALYFIGAAFGTEGAGAMAAYRTAFFVLLGAFCAIELRVQAGSRLTKTGMIWMHLATAVPFYAALGILAFVATPVWLVGIMALLGTVALVSGVLVFGRKPPAS